jgi:hypothetical protein
MNDQRLNILAVVCGKKGTGKTTFTRKTVAAKPRVIFLMTVDHPAFRDLRTFDETTLGALKLLTPDKRWHVRIVTTHTDEAFAAINEHISNAVIVYEDAAKYIPYNPPAEVFSAVLDSKQKNNDIIMQFHCLQDIPTRLFKNADYLTLFKVRDQPDQTPKAPRYIWPIVDQVNASSDPFYNITIELE